MWGYETEEQQIEAIKQFWKRYGSWLVSGVVAIILVWFGWQYWQERQIENRSQASTAYQQVLESLADEQRETANLQARQIIGTYPNTPYAQLSALILADLAVENNDLQQAEQQLEWAASNGTDVAIGYIAQLRLARIYLADNKLDAALKIVQTIDDETFSPTAKAIEGDVWVAKGDIDAARTAYQIALENLTPDNPWYELVSMKLVNLPTSS